MVFCHRGFAEVDYYSVFYTSQGGLQTQNPLSFQRSHGWEVLVGAFSLLTSAIRSPKTSKTHVELDRPWGGHIVIAAKEKLKERSLSKPCGWITRLHWGEKSSINASYRSLQWKLCVVDWTATAMITSSEISTLDPHSNGVLKQDSGPIALCDPAKKRTTLTWSTQWRPNENALMICVEVWWL